MARRFGAPGFFAVEVLIFEITILPSRNEVPVCGRILIDFDGSRHI
jgi:hypothetical protein